MSDQKTVPKGLRDNEVERGNFKKPPIPYIPVNNDIGKNVKSDARTFKVKLDDKTTVTASIWTGANPEGFLIHVISALGYIERSKLLEKWVIAKKTVKYHSVTLQSERDAVTALLVRSKTLQRKIVA